MVDLLWRNHFAAASVRYDWMARYRFDGRNCARSKISSTSCSHLFTSSSEDPPNLAKFFNCSLATVFMTCFSISDENEGRWTTGRVGSSASEEWSRSISANRCASFGKRECDCDRVITIDTLDEHSQPMNEIKSTQQTVNHWGRKRSLVNCGPNKELHGEEDRLTTRTEYTIFCG